MPRSSSSSEASTTDGDDGRSSMCSPRDTTRTKGSPLSEEFVTLPQAQCGIIKERTQDAEGVTLGLMVKNTIHKTKKMSLRYFFNGAMPSEQTENNIKIAQVVEWNYVAALESESEGIEAFVTNKTTLRVLKKRESEAFVFDLLADS